MVAPGWIPVERHDKEAQEVKDAYLALVRPGAGARRRTSPTPCSTSPARRQSFVTGQTLCVNGGMTPW